MPLTPSLFKKTMLIAFLVTVIGTGGCDQVYHSDPTALDGYRDVKWGMSADEVCAVEGEPLRQNEGLLIYGAELLGYETLLLYYLDGGKVYKANEGVLRFKTSDLNKYLEAHACILADLKTKYGNPKEKRISWTNERFKGSPQLLAKAYSLGDVNSDIRWQTGKTEVKLRMEGTDEKFIYISIDCYNR